MPSRFTVPAATSRTAFTGSWTLMVWSDRAKSAAIQAGQAVDNTKPDALCTVEKQRKGAWEGRVRLWFHPESLRFTADRTAPAPYELIHD